MPMNYRRIPSVYCRAPRGSTSRVPWSPAESAFERRLEIVILLLAHDTLPLHFELGRRNGSLGFDRMRWRDGRSCHDASSLRHDLSEDCDGASRHHSAILGICFRDNEHCCNVECICGHH